MFVQRQVDYDLWKMVMLPIDRYRIWRLYNEKGPVLWKGEESHPQHTMLQARSLYKILMTRNPISLGDILFIIDYDYKLTWWFGHIIFKFISCCSVCDWSSSNESIYCYAAFSHYLVASCNLAFYYISAMFETCEHYSVHSFTCTVLSNQVRIHNQPYLKTVSRLCVCLSVFLLHD